MPNTREKLIKILADNATCISLGIKSCYECAYGRCEDCYTEALVDHLIANGVRLEEKQATSDENKWIPVTERLPETDKKVLCYKNGEIKIGKYLNAKYTDEIYAFRSLDMTMAFGATHWMPLPEPPKGE